MNKKEAKEKLIKKVFKEKLELYRYIKNAIKNKEQD